jgi:hypothetical protein
MFGRPCKTIRLDIPDYLRGKLDSIGTNRVRSHLSTCVQCSAIAREYSVLLDNLVLIAPVIPPASSDAIPRINAQIDRSATNPTAKRPKAIIFSRAVVGVSALAAAAIMYFLATMDSPVLKSHEGDALLDSLVTRDPDAFVSTALASGIVPGATTPLPGETGFDLASSPEEDPVGSLFNSISYSDLFQAASAMLPDRELVSMLDASDINSLQNSAFAL